jgi:hypothetical protein
MKAELLNNPLTVSDPPCEPSTPEQRTKPAKAELLDSHATPLRNFVAFVNKCVAHVLGPTSSMPVDRWRRGRNGQFPG